MAVSFEDARIIGGDQDPRVPGVDARVRGAVSAEDGRHGSGSGRDAYHWSHGDSVGGQRSPLPVPHPTDLDHRDGGCFPRVRLL